MAVEAGSEATGPSSSTDSPRSSPNIFAHLSPQPPSLVEEDEDRASCSTPYRSGSDSRKAREFIPEYKKDDKYWERRKKNNEAAKRSREKRRANDAMMEQEIAELKLQNDALRREIAMLRSRGEDMVDAVQSAPLPAPPPPPPPPPPPLPSALNSLDLVALQRLLTVLTSNNSTNNDSKHRREDYVVEEESNLLSRVKVDETPLDLSGPKVSPLVMCLQQSQQMPRRDQMTSLSELAILTSNSPPVDTPAKFLHNHPLPVQHHIPSSDINSWKAPPETAVTSPPIGLQALLSAAALAEPISSPSITWTDVSQQASPCPPPQLPPLPLGLHPRHQQQILQVNQQMQFSGPPQTPRRRSGPRSPPPTQIHDDERYRERRRRNNEAVRRCRENKRARLSMRDEVTGRLQSENAVLRSEVDGLNSEIQALRHLILANHAPKKGPEAEVHIHGQMPAAENNSTTVDPSHQPAADEQTQEQPQQTFQSKPPPLYALPKKGIPRVPIQHPLKRRITLPPSHLHAVGETVN